MANCFDLGCHSVVLTVSDGLAISRCETNVCVVSPCEAVDRCIAIVDAANLDRKNKRGLIAVLKAAGASFERGAVLAGMGQLVGFPNQVQAQIAPKHPSEAAAFIECAQKILDHRMCHHRVGSFAP